MFSRFEETAGSVMTYTTAITTAGIGAWFGQNWYLVLCAIAVVIRIFIDIQTYRRNKSNESK